MKLLVHDLENTPSIDFVYDYQNEIKNIDDIIGIKPAKFHLDAYLNEDELILSVSCDVELTMACAKTLKPVEQHLVFSESIVFSNEDDADFLLTDEIEISDIMFGYIIAEKPLVVYHPDAQDVSFEKKKSPHPAFADLDKLFKKS